VAILLEKGADVNAKGSYDWTALMKASFNGHTEIVTMLLDNGADVNAKNEHDWTALDWASYNEHTSVVVLLEKAKKVRDNKQKAMELVTNRVEKVPSLQTLAHRNIDTRATMLYNKAVMDSTVSPLGSKLGGKRKTRKSKKSNKRFRTSHKKK
jgi:ankyrin repeat protein